MSRIGCGGRQSKLGPGPWARFFSWADKETPQWQYNKWRLAHPHGCACAGCTKAMAMVGLCDEAADEHRRHQRGQRSLAARLWGSSDDDDGEGGPSPPPPVPATPTPSARSRSRNSRPLHRQQKVTRPAAHSSVSANVVDEPVADMKLSNVLDEPVADIELVSVVEEPVADIMLSNDMDYPVVDIKLQARDKLAYGTRDLSSATSKHFERSCRAVEEAKVEMEQAERLHKQISIVQPCLDISQRQVFRKLAVFASEASRQQQHWYIGSTASPQWRWNGGWYWASEEDASQPRDAKVYMPGHKLKYGSMHVVGCWADSTCAAMEEAAIVYAKATDGRWWLDNKAEDARGLAIRPHFGNSFLYVCTASALCTSNALPGYVEDNS